MTHALAASSVAAFSLLALAASAESATLSANRADLRIHHAYASLRSAHKLPAGFLGAPSVPHRVYEREGLTRDPNDCARWGCIGNN